MSRIYAIFSLCSIFLLIATFPASADTCPDPGSGAGGVADFREGCVECEEGPQTTCNEEFTLEMLDFERDLVLGLVTVTYEVYNVPDVSEGTDLNHWVLGLDLVSFQLCLADDKTLEDLFVGCSVNGMENGMDCGLVLPDPTTQLEGMKFEAVLTDGENQTFSLTLDEMALTPGLEVAEGCTVAATKAGDQDIQRVGRDVPGYVCVAGPVCSEEPRQFICPRSQGYWKTHPGEWPVESIELGCETYTKDEARVILWTPVRGDASLILAKQLIAAKLNIENGSDPAPVSDVIDSADELLCAFSGRLPYRVRPFTSEGQEMIEYARILDRYNNGWLTPSCVEE